MLKLLLNEIETAAGPVLLSDLSQTLGLDRGVVQDMIAFWVRKGRLQDDAVMTADTDRRDQCGPSCSGATTCVFTAKMPKTYSINEPIKFDTIK